MREKQCQFLSGIIEKETGISIQFEGKNSTFSFKTILYPENANWNWDAFMEKYKEIDESKITKYSSETQQNAMEIQSEYKSLVELMEIENELIIIDGYDVPIEE